MIAYKHALAQFQHRWKISLLSSIGIILSALCLVVAGHLTQMATASIMQSIQKHGGNHVTIMVHNGKEISEIELSQSLRSVPHLTGVYTVSSNYIDIDSQKVPVIGTHVNNQQFFQLNPTSGRILHRNDPQPYALFSKDLIEFLEQRGTTVTIGQQLIGGEGIIEVIGISEDYQLPMIFPCPNGVIFVSPDTYTTLFPDTPINTIMLEVDHFDHLSNVSSTVGKILEKDYPGLSFNTIDPTQILKMTKGSILMVKSLIYLFVTVCAALGGIGIMNMTIANITSRHTELALRVSFGATLKQIQRMLMLETTLLCLCSSAVGITLGLIGVRLIAFFFEWPFILAPTTIFNSLLFSLIVGIVSSLYPTRMIRKIPIATILKGD